MWQSRLLSFHFLLNIALELYFDVDMTKLSLPTERKRIKENEETVRTIAAKRKRKKSVKGLDLQTLLWQIEKEVNGKNNLLSILAAP